jgi:L-alanine-DL-glutamate epimerase-like enolase superfamily enzyme
VLHVERLETQYDETPLFDALVGGALPDVLEGKLRVPDDSGIGVRLDAAFVQRLGIDVRI